MTDKKLKNGNGNENENEEVKKELDERLLKEKLSKIKDDIRNIGNGGGNKSQEDGMTGNEEPPTEAISRNESTDMVESSESVEEDIRHGEHLIEKAEESNLLGNKGHQKKAFLFIQRLLVFVVFLFVGFVACAYFPLDLLNSISAGSTNGMNGVNELNEKEDEYIALLKSRNYGFMEDFDKSFVERELKKLGDSNKARDWLPYPYQTFSYHNELEAFIEPEEDAPFQVSYEIKKIEVSDITTIVNNASRDKELLPSEEGNGDGTGTGFVERTTPLHFSITIPEDDIYKKHIVSTIKFDAEFLDMKRKEGFIPYIVLPIYSNLDIWDGKRNMKLETVRITKGMEEIIVDSPPIDLLEYDPLMYHIIFENPISRERLEYSFGYKVSLGKLSDIKNFVQSQYSRVLKESVLEDFRDKYKDGTRLKGKVNQGTYRMNSGVCALNIKILDENNKPYKNGALDSLDVIISDLSLQNAGSIAEKQDTQKKMENDFINQCSSISVRKPIIDFEHVSFVKNEYGFIDVVSDKRMQEQ